MESKEERKKRLQELRKLEKQAKQLIYKMRRLENEWIKLRQEFPETKSIPSTLGDALANWNKLGRV